MTRRTLFIALLALIIVAPLGLTQATTTDVPAAGDEATAPGPGRMVLAPTNGTLALVPAPSDTAQTPPPGLGEADPWIDATGDRMAGDLDLGENALVLSDGRLWADGASLSFGGQAVCLAGQVCTASPLSGQPPIEVDDQEVRLMPCGVGELLRADTAGWRCATDADTTYHAGDGITIGSDHLVHAILGETVDAAEIEDGTLTDADLGQGAAVDPAKVEGTAATLTGDQTFDRGTLHVDATSDQVGVGTTAPAAALDIQGDARVSGRYTYDAPRTGRTVIDPSAFVLASTDEDDTWTLHPDGYGYISDTPDTRSAEVRLSTPIDLPTDARLQALVCYGYDGSSSIPLDRLRATLYERALNEAQAHSIGEVQLTTDSVGTTPEPLGATASLDDHLVSDGASYYLRVFFRPDWPSPDIRFYGCATDYSYDTVVVG